MNEPDIYSPPDAELHGAADRSSSIDTDSNMASRWARLGAYLVDTLLLILFFGVVLYLTGTSWEELGENELTVVDHIYYFFVGLGGYLFLNGYLLHKQGQTIGKWALGIKIVSFKSNKVLPLWKVFLIRYVPPVTVAMLPFVGIVLALVNDLFIFRKDKRCIHDHLAGTKVIKEHAQ